MEPLPNERPLPTLNATELLLQFKLMKAMGYKSLFDVNFRRELRNPYRKILYYRLVILEEYSDRKWLHTALTGAVDRLSFFSDPELYRKVKSEEDRIALADPDLAAAKRAQAMGKYEKDQRQYVPPTAEEQRKTADALSNTRNQHSF